MRMCAINDHKIQLKSTLCVLHICFLLLWTKMFFESASKIQMSLCLDPFCLMFQWSQNCHKALTWSCGKTVSEFKSASYFGGIIPFSCALHCWISELWITAVTVLQTIPCTVLLITFSHQVQVLQLLPTQLFYLAIHVLSFLLHVHTITFPIFWTAFCLFYILITLWDIKMFPWPQ